ncbi:MAG: topoisomerase-4 subunit B, partial [Saprospiraceae bacterium]
PIVIGKDAKIDEMLSFFMGKNTPDRQKFIIDNLQVEEDLGELMVKQDKEKVA